MNIVHRSVLSASIVAVILVGCAVHDEPEQESVATTQQALAAPVIADDGGTMDDAAAPPAMCTRDEFKQSCRALIDAPRDLCDTLLPYLPCVVSAVPFCDDICVGKGVLCAVACKAYFKEAPTPTGLLARRFANDACRDATAPATQALLGFCKATLKMLDAAEVWETP